MSAVRKVNSDGAKSSTLNPFAIAAWQYSMPFANVNASSWIALAEKKGTDPNLVRILIQNDVLKEYIARGTQIYPPRAGLRIVGAGG